MKSSFFAACLDKGFKEGEDSLITLPEDDSDVMGKVLEYLYGGNFQYPAIEPLRKWDDPVNDEEERPHWAFLTECYIAADKYCLEDLQNKIMDFVKDVIQYRPVYASGIQELTKAGLTECPLREFLLQEMASELSDDATGSFGCGMNTEHFKLLSLNKVDAEALVHYCISILKEPRGSFPSRYGNACDWHIHETSKKCSN